MIRHEKCCASALQFDRSLEYLTTEDVEDLDV